jgi:hypothetical protein
MLVCGRSLRCDNKVACSVPFTQDEQCGKRGARYVRLLVAEPIRPAASLGWSGPGACICCRPAGGRITPATDRSHAPSETRSRHEPVVQEETGRRSPPAHVPVWYLNSRPPGALSSAWHHEATDGRIKISTRRACSGVVVHDQLETGKP